MSVFMVCLLGDKLLNVVQVAVEITSHRLIAETESGLHRYTKNGSKFILVTEESYNPRKSDNYFSEILDCYLFLKTL